MRECEGGTVEDVPEQSNLLEQVLTGVPLLGTASDEHGLTRLVAALAVELLGATTSELQLLNPTTGELVTVATGGLLDIEAAKLQGRKTCLADLKPLFTSEFRAARSFFVPEGHEVWRKIPSAPLHMPADGCGGSSSRVRGILFTWLEVSPDAVIGLLSLSFLHIETSPPPHILEAVAVFALAAAWAIKRARDLHRLEEQQSGTRVFLESVSRELARSRDLHAIGEIAVHASAELIGAEGCSLYVIRGDRLELTHASHLARTRYIGRQEPISDAPGSGLVSYVVASGQSLRLRDGQQKMLPTWSQDKDHSAYLRSQECKSLLIVPVRVGEGKIVGVLHLENKTGAEADQGFDQDDEEMLHFLAEQVASALEKVALHEVVEKWEREGLEDDLHELINWYHSGVVLPLEAMEAWVLRQDHARALSMLQDVVHRAHTALTELKAIHTAVYSRYLEEEDLEKALRRMAGAWQDRGRHALVIEVEVDPTVALTTPVKNGFLRIASGALSNAVLHSGVDERPDGRIWVRLVRDGEQAVLEVGDNGQGIERPIRTGYGLNRITQIAEQAEAVLEIQSAPGRGTRVIVRKSLQGVSL